jgi:hypothetical protein
MRTMPRLEVSVEFDDGEGVKKLIISPGDVIEQGAQNIPQATVGENTDPLAPLYSDNFAIELDAGTELDIGLDLDAITELYEPYDDIQDDEDDDQDDVQDDQDEGMDLSMNYQPIVPTVPIEYDEHHTIDTAEVEGDSTNTAEAGNDDKNTCAAKEAVMSTFEAKDDAMKKDKPEDNLIDTVEVKSIKHDPAHYGSEIEMLRKFIARVSADKSARGASESISARRNLQRDVLDPMDQILLALDRHLRW